MSLCVVWSRGWYIWSGYDGVARGENWLEEVTLLLVGWMDAYYCGLRAKEKAGWDWDWTGLVVVVVYVDDAGGGEAVLKID
jgi:hypothetical protein